MISNCFYDDFCNENRQDQTVHTKNRLKPFCYYNSVLNQKNKEQSFLTDSLYKIFILYTHKSASKKPFDADLRNK
ncbi:hypothetical protein HMPREF9554_01575 [Treponema phagedenis F0421]|nr:hypothetical protein HMPREF9554_01575 [Treponema phagedenis F0421]